LEQLRMIGARLRGLVGKGESAPYRAGRSLSWLKVRQREYRVEERGWDPMNKAWAVPDGS